MTRDKQRSVPRWADRLGGVGSHATVHKQVRLSVGDVSFDVDHEIVGFVAWLWRAGIRTRASCQNFDRSGRVWVVFDDKQSAERFAKFGRNLDVWPQVIPFEIRRADLAGCDDRYARLGVNYQIQFPREMLPVVLAAFRFRWETQRFLRSSKTKRPRARPRGRRRPMSR